MTCSKTLKDRLTKKQVDTRNDHVEPLKEFLRNFSNGYDKYGEKRRAKKQWMWILKKT